jgi:glycosyltransferase involved in cell wall biosynthesis
MAGSQSNERRHLRVCMLTVGEYDSHPRVRRQAEALAARGDTVTAVALHAPGRPEHQVIDGVTVVRLPVHKYRGQSARAYLSLYGGFASRAAAWAARRLGSFDVIQVNTMPEALVFSASLHRIAGVPILLDVHDRTVELFASKFGANAMLMNAVRFNERASLGFATEILTVHEPYAETLRQRTRRPVTVVMNCPDERLFPPRAWRGWDPAGEVVFGYHGLIAPRHGLTYAAEALSMLHADIPDARLHVWGSGDGLQALRERVRELGLDEAVRLPESIIPITQIPSELESVHIGLVPSIRDPWTDRVLPTKLLEYTNMGIPVISFRNPVIEQVFPDDALTYVDPVGPEALRTAMLALAKDPERARQQAMRAREIMDRMTWDQQKHIYFDVIDRLAQRRRRQRERAMS